MFRLAFLADATAAAVAASKAACSAPGANAAPAGRNANASFDGARR
ncbi:hypothetical protein [Streptomyces sp. NRRL F-5123]|nr:hypothetical protein [Streptomyces sp. NRRL F-5123]